MSDIDIYHEELWEIHDPDSAQVIAHFYSERHARAFVAFINAGRAIKIKT